MCDKKEFDVLKEDEYPDHIGEMLREIEKDPRVPNLFPPLPKELGWFEGESVQLSKPNTIH